jgi:glycosyltransferase involved in cell wall biosynthesis
LNGETHVLTEVLFSFATGGSERIGAAVATHASERGVRTTACATHGVRGPISEMLEAEGIECEAVQQGPGGRIGRALRLYRHMRRHGTTVVHVHHFNMASIVYWPARLAGVRRIVVTEHSNYRMRTEPADRRRAWRYGRLVDGVTVVHQGLADYLAADIGLDPAGIRVVINGVDTERFRPRAARQASGKTVVGTVGRLHPDKDPLNLARAIARMADSDRAGIDVMFIGDGDLRGPLESLVASEGLGDTVRVLGERHDVGELLHSMDIFVLPSRTEGLPVALLEAMSSGLGVVATDVGGVAAVIGHAGIVVPSENPDALAAGILTYARDPDRLAADGREARRRAVEYYDREVMFRGYAQALGLPRL